MSSYRLVAVPDADAAARRARGRERRSTSSWSSAATCCMWETVRIHLDEVRGLGSFLELEAVAEPGSDLAREREPGRAPARAARDPRRRPARGLLRRRAPWRRRRDGPVGEPDAELSRSPARPPAARTRPTRTSPSARRCARPTAAATPAPTSRTPPTRRASARRPPPSARSSPAAAGEIAEVVVAAPSPELCTPCGGCRQRLREFARRRRADPPRRPRARAPHDDARPSCCRSPSARSTWPHERAAAAAAIAERAPGFTPRLGLMLGSGLGELAEQLDDRVEIPYGEIPGFHAGGLAGHAGDAQPRACSRASPSSIFAGRWHVYEGIGGDAITTPVRTLQGARARRRSCSPTRPARCAPRPVRAASSASATTSTCSASTR